jgi:hypothetical protein
MVKIATKIYPRNVKLLKLTQVGFFLGYNMQEHFNWYYNIILTITI